MSSILGVQTSGSDFGPLSSQFTSSVHAGDRSSNSALSHTQRVHSWFQSGLPTPPTTKEMTGISISNNYGSYATGQPYTNGYSNGHSSSTHSRVPSETYQNSLHPARVPATSDNVKTEHDQNNTIASHLQIPESVNKSKGSLAEFAAEITCLFWFEDAATLKYAEELAIDAYPNRGLGLDATPTVGFRKWVTTILSTTQVGKNVILLALMFIYRLKRFNPSVSGKRGSEFRLLTIALMLGNKFLDDNTYTNKTWAEVSGISVTEIHIMEVEFLSNMRYELYASEADWMRWKALLGKFGSFYEKASRYQPSVNSTTNPPITPTSQVFNSKLPSPPSKHHNSMTVNYNTLPNPMTTAPHLSYSPVRQPSLGMISDRKRSLDATDVLPLPSAKRPHYLPPATTQSSPSSMHPLSFSTTPSGQSNNAQFSGHRVPQLPMPRIATTNVGIGTHLAPLSLPPARAISSMYPVTTPGWNPPLTPTSAILPNMTGSYQTTNSPAMDPTRGGHSRVNSTHTSPVNLYGPSTPTRPGLSPSYFLNDRSSPYRPVRHVNTLLIPPPSAAMQNAIRSVDYQQMHYQPLGKSATERRPGPVPYLYPESQHQSNVSTPSAQIYRTL